VSRPEVVIVGGGFAGLSAARGLARAPVRVTLVDRRNFHLFQPLLYQVATGGLSPADITSPLRSVLRRQLGARVLQAEVTDIDLEARRVRLGADEALAYDTLIVATGARHHYFGNDAWERHAPGLKTVEDATRMRSTILSAFERAERCEDDSERAALLTFVVVGGGPTGVELAGAIGELAHTTLRRDFRRFDPASTRVLLVEGRERVLPPFPPRLSAAAQRSLERLGVEVLNDTRVEQVDEAGVELVAGEHRQRVRAHTVLWAAGVQASRLAGTLARRGGADLDDAGRIVVDRRCTLPGHPEVIVLGDMARCVDGRDERGDPLPGLASVASQQGRYAARLVRARLRGRAEPEFRYRDRGTLAVIGRAAAVADLGRLRFAGYPAWLFWLFVHLMLLVGFENRVLVFVQWSLSYLTRNRGARLITGSNEQDY
jgi:NADH dehydrogenase